MNRSLLGKKPWARAECTGKRRDGTGRAKNFMLYSIQRDFVPTAALRNHFLSLHRTYSGVNAEETMPTKAKAKEIQTLSGDPSMKMYT